MTLDTFEHDKKVLELDARKKLYHLIKKLAGSHFRELQRQSGLSVGSIQHHLHSLAKNGLIREVRKSNNLVYFPREFVTSDTHLLSALRQQSTRKILICILINGKINQEPISNFAGISPSTTTWHLKKLEQDKLIKSERTGRKTQYQLTCDKQTLIKLLITYQESFVDTLVDRVIEMWELD